MKNFLTKLKRSLSDRSFYRDLASGAEPFQRRYILGLATASAIVVTAFVTVSFYREGLPAFRALVSQSVPADLVAEVKSGELSVNRPMPFVVPVPADEELGKIGRANLLVVDLDAEPSLDVTARYDTVAFANRTMIVTEKSNGQVQAVPLKEWPDFTFNRDAALGWLDAAAKYAWIIGVAAVIPVALVGAAALLVGSFFAAIAVWLALKVASRGTTFRRAFALAAHAYTFVVALNLALTLLGTENLSGIFSVLAVAGTATVLAFGDRSAA